VTGIGQKKLLPIDETDGTVAVAAAALQGIPFPPQAILAFLLDFPVQAQDSHIPKIHGINPATGPPPTASLTFF
jgi:hypothetical protein